jgi:tetratricopeptide (TPR) repeat protein
MNKQQILVAGTGVLLLLVLYIFGNTIPPHRMPDAATKGAPDQAEVKTVGLQDILQPAEARLSPAQLSYVNRLKQSVVRGDVATQQLFADRQLARFWKDSVAGGFLPYTYYTGEAAKLENSEKSLTFAARLNLEGLEGQDDAPLKKWMATNAKDLLQRALVINPNNDSAKVGLGASYIFGATVGDPTEVMQGIQKILEVARRDSTNMYAQFMLGYGGVVSGQLDKAVERLTTVIRHEPNNVEAILLLAQAHQQKGDKAAAVKSYRTAEKLIANPEMLKAIEQQIQTLQ